jgi:acetyl-CoA acetyltransferase family protein
MPSAYVYDAVRTPFGRYGGGLASVRPDDMAATIVGSLMARSPEFDPARIDDVVFGNANGAGEENRNVARMAVLLAGLPVSVTGTTVNRLCGSSLDAAAMASRQIEVGDADVVVTGGVESMTRAPLVMKKPEKPFPAGKMTAESTTLGWRLVNPAMPSEWTVSLGEGTEMLAERYGVGRTQQDEFALRSHHLADQAWNAGFYDDLTVLPENATLTRDEAIRAESTLETLAGLRTAFRAEDGTITAGNASPLTDGASGVLLGSEAAASLLGRDPLARIAGRAVAGVEPPYFGIAPVEATNRALYRAGIGWDDVGAVELNEAFAAQSVACIDHWGIDPEIVNVHGGAIAVGHPLGASGGRILGTLVKSMRIRGVRWGVATLCIGVGQGEAVVVENQDAA